jgi:hypothetical protein
MAIPWTLSPAALCVVLITFYGRPAGVKQVERILEYPAGYSYIYHRPRLPPDKLYGDRPFKSSDSPAATSQGDYYLDARTGRSLGQDGGTGGGFRIIDRTIFDSIKTIYPDITIEPATKALQSRSSIIGIDRDGIQKEAERVNEMTQKDSFENQTILILHVTTTDDIPTARVTSLSGPEGSTDETTLDIQKSLDPALINVRFYGGIGNILLGQIHGHPPKKKTDAPPGSGTSDKDRNSAQEKRCVIYALESFRGGNDVVINRVTSDGVRANSISTLQQRFDFGSDALRCLSTIK